MPLIKVTNTFYINTSKIVSIKSNENTVYIETEQNKHDIPINKLTKEFKELINIKTPINEIQKHDIYCMYISLMCILFGFITHGLFI